MTTSEPDHETFDSYAEEVEVKCGACGAMTRQVIPIIVDAAADPELESAAQNGALRIHTCPNGHTAPIWLPLLLRRPEREPRLVFYPSCPAETDEVRAQLLSLLQITKISDLGFDSPEAAAEQCCVLPGYLMAKPVQPYESYLKLVGSTPALHARFMAAHNAREHMRAEPGKLVADAAVAAWSALAAEPGFAEAPVWLQRGAQSELAFAYDQCFNSGGDTADADRAIKSFEAALSHPIEHAAYGALLRRNYATALAKRFDRRGSLQDLDAAIATLRLAVPELSGATAADVQGLLASALTARRALLGPPGDDPRSILEALADNAETESARLTAEANLAIASAYSGRGPYDTEGAADAIDRIEAAIGKATVDSQEKAVARDALGRLRQDRYDALGEADDLDLAIEAREAACEWLDHVTAPRGDVAITLLNNLTYSLRARFALTGRLADLEAASRSVRRALALTPRGQTAHPVLLDQWGGIARDFYHRDKDPRWLEEAIRVLRGALSLVRRGDPASLTIPASLGLCLAERFALSEDRADLEEAIDLLRPSVSDALPGRNRADALLNLAAALQQRFHIDADPADAHEAVDLLQTARCELSTSGVDDARIVAAIAAAKADVASVEAGATNGSNVADEFRAACYQAAQYPELQLHTSRRWLEHALRLGLWDDGAEAAEFGLAAIERLTRAQVDRFGRASWLVDAQGLSAAAAYVMARRNDLEAAIRSLERGRAQLLARALQSDDVDLQRLRDQGHGALAERYEAARGQVERREIAERMIEDVAFKGDSRPNRSGRGFIDYDPTGFSGLMLQAFDDLRAAERSELDSATLAVRAIPGFESFLSADSADLEPDLAGASLAYLVVTEAGSMILTRDVGATRVAWIDDAPLPEVRDRVFGPGGFRAFQLGQKRASGLDAILDWAGKTFIRSLIELLDPHGKGRLPARLVLVPTGPLAMIPLHASSIDTAGSSCLLDVCSVEYAPSAAVWSRCRERRNQRGGADAKILVVANPRPQPPEWVELGAADLEAAAIEVLLPGQSKVLRRRDATEEAVGAAIEEANYLHFACHGLFDEVHPMQSCLVLAEGKPLRLLQHLFKGTRLSKVRLVVLSACQTGLIGAAKLPEESIGLVSAFIEAGAPGVVGSLWPVADASTALLMARFYCELFEDGRQVTDPAEALRRAQLWLKNVTAETLRSLIEARRPAEALLTPVERRFASAFLQGGLAECVPLATGAVFAAPEHWSGFRYHGA